MFLLPAFTRQGHEHQDLWSPCDGMHRLGLSIYSHPKEFWGNGVTTYVISSKGINPALPAQRRIEPAICITHYRLSYFGPLSTVYWKALMTCQKILHACLIFKRPTRRTSCDGRMCWSTITFILTIKGDLKIENNRSNVHMILR